MRLCSAVLVAALLVALPARAQSQGGLSDFTPAGWTSVAKFLGGVATGFVAHEGCHFGTNWALGSSPHLTRVTYLGAIPFFAITPTVSCRNGSCRHDDGRPWSPGPIGFYSLVSAGYQCGHIADEIILTTEPGLRYTEAPFRKGVLAFNTLLSVGYAISNWANVEPQQGDLANMDRVSRVPRGILAATIFVPAVLDIARFVYPEARWIPYVSWVSKGAIVGFAFST